MNKKKRVFLIYSLAAFFVFAISLGVLAGCKRSSTIVQPTQMNATQTAEKRISEYSNPNAVITVNELNNILNDPNLVILDARANNSKDFRTNYQDGHIPGAIVYMRSQYTDSARGNRVASPNVVQMYFSTLGIDKYSRIVIYGNDNGLQGRVYWMLKMYGCDNQVQILDGGIEGWKEAGYQLSNQRTKRNESKFAFNPVKTDPSFTTNMNEIGQILSSNNPGNIIVDARSNNEYVSSHIPSSVNVSVTDVLNADKTFKPVHELTSILTAKGITPDKKVFVYSYTGSRSSLIWYVLHELMGYTNVINYDSGFKEWISRARPIEKGAPKPVNPAQ